MKKNTREVFDALILGAGLAGMTAAYELRDFNIRVLEQDDRVGGRTLSGDWEGYWYNLGAQFVWDERTLGYCRELGVPYGTAVGASSALYVRDRLVRAANPYMLLLKMPLSLSEKLDFALTITRLRRLANRLDKVDRHSLDDKPMSDLIMSSKPITKHILDAVSRSGAGLATDEVSGYFGLGYAIHLFGGDVNDTLKGVVGGTQQIAIAMQQAVGSARVGLGCTVESIALEDSNVVVSYVGPQGKETLRAKTCICTLPAEVLPRVINDLRDDKRQALESRSPYRDGLIVVWLTGEGHGMSWDRLLSVPIIDGEFDLVSNQSFFLRTSVASRQPGGVIATLGGAGLTEFSDEELKYRSRKQLTDIFPSAGQVLDKAQAIVKRWKALPLFRTGSLRHQEAIRRPIGSIYFAGDYTAQPGTPGAVGSGYYAARSVRDKLTAN